MMKNIIATFAIVTFSVAFSMNAIASEGQNEQEFQMVVEQCTKLAEENQVEDKEAYIQACFEEKKEEEMAK